MSLSPRTLGRPLACSGPQFLLYSISGEGMTLNFMTAPLGLKICILEPWESLPQKGGPCPPPPLAPQPELLSRGRQCRTLAEACKGFSENWLYPDSHASRQPPQALSPEFGGPRGAEGVDTGLARSEVMASSGNPG